MFYPILKQLTMNPVLLNPTQMNEPESAFYFTLKNQKNPGDNIWYKKSPSGKNEVKKPVLKATPFRCTWDCVAQVSDY